MMPFQCSRVQGRTLLSASLHLLSLLLLLSGCGIPVATGLTLQPPPSRQSGDAEGSGASGAGGGVDLLELCEKSKQCKQNLSNSSIFQLQFPEKEHLFELPSVRYAMRILTDSDTVAGLLPCDAEVLKKGCQDPEDFVFMIDVHFGKQVPAIVVIPGSQTPNPLSEGQPWISMEATAEVYFGDLKEFLSEICKALGTDGNLKYGISVAVDAALFSHPESAEVMVVHFVQEGRVVLNPKLAKMLSDNLRSLLNSQFSSLRATAIRNTLAPYGHLPIQSKVVALGQVVDQLWAGEARGLKKVPWKCFACVVAMAYVMPVATNYAVQGLGTIYCRLKHLNVDDCMQIRYLLIALAVLLVPFEAFPIASVCHITDKCHS